MGTNRSKQTQIRRLMIIVFTACISSNVCDCHMLRILAVAVCRIGDICCLPASAHQPFSFNSLGLSAPEETGSRNVRASGIPKFGYEGMFKNLDAYRKRNMVKNKDSFYYHSICFIGFILGV